MAPKSALLTAGGSLDPPPGPRHPRGPLTTKEKMDYYAAKKKEPPKPLTPPPASPVSDTESTSTPKKRPQPKALPPPGEIFQPPKPKAPRPRQPLTTKEKIEAEKARKRKEVAKSTDRAVEKRKKGAEKKAAAAAKKAQEKAAKEEAKRKRTAEAGEVVGKRAGKKRKVCEPSTLSVLAMANAPSAVQFRGKGVLERPTLRARQERLAMQRKEVDADRGEVVNAEQAKVRKEEKPFPIMKLPEEVRARIWREAVVFHPYCVWPGHAKGREQPDLAMTGREVREEVLGVFYARNVFGVDVTSKSDPVIGQAGDGKGDRVGEVSEKKSGGAMVCEDGKQRSEVRKPAGSIQKAGERAIPEAPHPLDEIKPWAQALESTLLRQIQHWVFSYMPEIQVPGRAFPEVDDSRSLVVYLRTWCEPSETDTKGHWRANVEIHREACCVLPGQAEYQACVINMSPDWLNEMVGVILDDMGKNNGLTAATLMGFAKVISARAEDLVDRRCESVVRSREVGGGVRAF